MKKLKWICAIAGILLFIVFLIVKATIGFPDLLLIVPGVFIFLGLLFYLIEMSQG
jgi:hypothetical protein